MAESHFDPAQEQMLIRRMQQGQDAAAFRVLYRYYFPKVYAYIGYRTPTREDAEDLVAETFLRVVENIKSFRWQGEGSFAAWLFRIAHNLLSNYFRNPPGAKELDLAAVGDLESDMVLPSDAVMHKQRVLALRRLIATLSPRRQEVLTLKFFAELRNKEIAALLGLDERTVASHLARGLRDLHEQYRQHVASQEKDPQ